MDIEFDQNKSLKNARERNLPFELAAQFEWETSLRWIDERRLYPEKRILAFGYIANRLHVLVYSPIANGIRVISLRKANQREITKYEKAINRQRW
jgi:uncharacterized DUF497 family protein